MPSPPIVFVVDDDSAIRSSIGRLIKSAGLRSKMCRSAHEFLTCYDPAQPGCVILDVRMPGMSGLKLQEFLASKKVPIPVIIITGFADVPMAVRAMRAGAANFIEKPFDPQVLLETVRRAIDKDAEYRRNQSKIEEINVRISRLTPRERQVMELVVDGKPNKVIASDLGLSQKTVEFHRAHVMTKTGVLSVAELVQLITRYKGWNN
jgi:FixJ family two-component response regulator